MRCNYRRILGFDVVDLNCGCPVDKVTKDGSGSAMLKTPELIGDIISNMVAAVKIPVTVKIRAGWDSEHINAPEIVENSRKSRGKSNMCSWKNKSSRVQRSCNWDYIKAARRSRKYDPCYRQRRCCRWGKRSKNV